MSTFKNISGDDRSVAIDGRNILVLNGDTFDVADVHDASLVDQPHFELVKGKKKSDAAPVDEPTPAVADITEGDI